MKIRYKKKRLRFYLVMTIVWLIFAMISLIYSDFDNWTAYFWLGISSMYIGMYSFSYVKQYLTVENGVIYKNQPFTKKISLNDIKSIKKFAGDYILKTDNSELTINTQIIDENSLKTLNGLLDDLALEGK